MIPLRVGIAGATGYLGSELLRFLVGHPGATVQALASSSRAGSALADEIPEFERVLDTVLMPYDEQDPASAFAECDVVFLAMPHGKALAAAPCILAAYENIVVIDLSGDHRLRDPAVARATYGAAPEVGLEAAYGLPELNAHAIRGARLVANPGCYPTASILAAAPLLAAGLVETDLVVDAKSGVSGAGREPSHLNHYPEANERVLAYKVGEHRHEVEIEQALSDTAGEHVDVTFVPHLVPMNRGILATVHLKARGGVLASDEIAALYRKHYANAPFVRVRTNEPDTRTVRHTNFIDLKVTPIEAKNRYVVTAAIDNLVKGGSGQAIQNMNVRFGRPETAGLLRAGGGP